MSTVRVTVSVVIPSLNDAEMLRRCLDDLAVQTRAPDEIIVIDNGSTDETTAVAVAAGARVVHEPIRGVLRATARGFDAAAGSVIARLDADSRPPAHWTARLADGFDADPTRGAVTGTGSFYGCGPVWRVVGRYGYLGGYFAFMGALIGHRPLFGSNFALRRDVWIDARTRAHIDDPHAHDDLDISFALRTGVDFDRRLRVGVSARPFADVAGFLRRADWAFHVVGVNLRERAWLPRVVDGFRARRARRARQAARRAAHRRA
ncbi:glycosyltransferase family A protein [Microbacterium sp.]|uniref:glycosyltransferase family A protein n=1 Tax=Microbacterium sp. TaxID=51671 RepID=UPI003A91C84D